MEDPTKGVKCPDCDGVGLKTVHNWKTNDDYFGDEECQLCLGSGEISEMDWGYYNKDKKESFNEDKNSDEL